MILDFVFVLPVIYGLYLFVKTPLNLKYGLPTWSDPALGFTLSIITAMYFYFVHFSLTELSIADTAPCGRFSKQMECYNLSPGTCLTVWQSSHGSCDEQLAEIRKARPSFLSGTFIDTCVGRNFDKMMQYNRKNKSSPSCQAYFLKVGEKD
jgi:hypothetical protein